MRTKKHHGHLSKVAQLPFRIRRQINKMLIPSGGQLKTYQEISDWLKKRGYIIGKSSIGRYFQYSRADKRSIQCRIEINLLNLYEALTKKASKSLDPKDIEQVLRLGETLEKSKGGE